VLKLGTVFVDVATGVDDHPGLFSGSFKSFACIV
jgi:hypothetical protein